MVERRPPKPEVEGSSPSSPALVLLRGICNMITAIRRYFKSISTEMNKVSWMTKRQILNSTFIVGVFALVITLFLFLLDLALVNIIDFFDSGDLG